MYYVYILVCLQTGRFYVGETDEHSAGQLPARSPVESCWIHGISRPT
jgi:hypothetical protein